MCCSVEVPTVLQSLTELADFVKCTINGFKTKISPYKIVPFVPIVTFPPTVFSSISHLRICPKVDILLDLPSPIEDFCLCISCASCAPLSCILSPRTQVRIPVSHAGQCSVVMDCMDSCFGATRSRGTWHNSEKSALAGVLKGDYGISGIWAPKAVWSLWQSQPQNFLLLSCVGNSANWRNVTIREAIGVHMVHYRYFHSNSCFQSHVLFSGCSSLAKISQDSP